ncbi:MAG: hypothetical protein IPM98_02505 [Lewinellaceae bacterium]|nr:hypothetical protein [Lewinellaceae bacterium]
MLRSATLLLFTVLLHLSVLGGLRAQCQITTLPYGVVQTDINRGQKIIPTQDGHFVIAGVWNDEAFLLKVNAQGQQVALKKFGADITGTSSFRDVVETADGGFVAVGECLNCVVPDDALAKVVAIKTDASLNLDPAIGVKKFGQVTVNGVTTLAERFSPSILRTGNGFLLASAVATGGGLNPHDVLVTELAADLTPAWDKMHHTGFFESPYDLAAGTDGFFLTINRAFVPEAILLKVNTAGDQVWQKPVAANLLRGIVFLPDSNEVAVIGDITPSGQDQQAMLRRFDAGTGDSLDLLLFGDMLADEGHDVQLLPNGDLLAGIVTNQPNPFGIYATSRIYRIQTYPLAVNCFYLIPNPDNITNMAIRSIVPLSENGKDFAATGIRGFYNRTFFHTRRDCEVTALSAALCPGETHILPNGQTVSTAGVYPVTLAAANGCDSIVQTTVSVFAPIIPTQVGTTICPGYTYTLPNGQTVSMAGTYPVTLATTNGCDSIVQTTVSVFAPIPPTQIVVALCPGETHSLPNGQTVSMAGTYPVMLVASNGCDSIVQTTVSVFAPIPSTQIVVALCPGETHSLPNGQTVSMAGTYPVMLVASNGCDSIVQTTVSVFAPIPPTQIVVALCPGETHSLPNGQTVSMAGTYPVTLTAANGCDSLVRTSVSVFAPIPPTQIVVALCPGETHSLPNGQTVSTAGMYPVTLTAANGCDSIVRTNVSVYAPITVGSVEITTDNGQGTGSIKLENVQGGSGGTYQFDWSNGLTAPIIENLPGGVYQVTITDIAGCTAVFEYAVMTVSLSEVANSAALQVSPNPFTDQIRVLLLLENPTSARFEWRLVNVYGQNCRAGFIRPGSSATVEGNDLPAGLYFLQLLENGRPVQVRKLVK